MLKKLLISLLAVGAAAAPYGTTEFMDLVADDDDTFYCIIGGDCSHWVDVIRREVGLTMDELITLATDVSVFKLNEPDENLRWDTASPTASDFERAGDVLASRELERGAQVVRHVAERAEDERDVELGPGRRCGADRAVEHRGVAERRHLDSTVRRPAALRRRARRPPRPALALALCFPPIHVVIK